MTSSGAVDGGEVTFKVKAVGFLEDGCLSFRSRVFCLTGLIWFSSRFFFFVTGLVLEYICFIIQL